MTLQDRQLKLDTIRYRNHETAGKHDYCNKCTCQYMSRSCIATPAQRSCQNLCAKAYIRLRGIPYNSFTEILNSIGKRSRHYYQYGLHKSEMGNKD